MLNKEITFVKNGNVLQLSGYFEYLQDNIDTKVIDGKVYVNTERVVRRITIDEIREKEWESGFKIETFHYESKELYDFHVEYVNGLAYGNITSQCSGCNQSQNDYVNAFILGHKKGMLPKWISNPRTFKYGESGVTPCKPHNVVDLVAFGYGYNNCVYIEIPLYKFLKLSKTKMKELSNESGLITSIRKYYGINDISKITTNDVFKIMNTYINYKEQYQQYATR
jgi:hypothetical protein